MSVTLAPTIKPSLQRTIVTPYLILALIQVLDIATTYFILHTWSARAEANPVTRLLLETTGLELGLMIGLAFKLSLVYLMYICQSGVKIVTAVYALVIFNNALFIVEWARLALTGQL